MSSAKHVLSTHISVGAITTTCRSSCSCGWMGLPRSDGAPQTGKPAAALLALATSMARMDGLQHAIEVATSVLPADLRPTFEY